MENQQNEFEYTREDLIKDIEGNIAGYLELVSPKNIELLKKNKILNKDGSFSLNKNVIILQNNEDVNAYASSDLRRKKIAKIDSLPGGGKGYVTDQIKISQGRLAETKEFELDDFLYVSGHIGVENDPIGKKIADEIFRNRSHYFSKDEHTFLYNYINYEKAEDFIKRAWTSNEIHYRSPLELVYNRKTGKGIGNYGLSVDVSKERGQTMTIDGVGAITSIESPVEKKYEENIVIFSDVVDILKASFLRDYKGSKLNDQSRLVMRQREPAILFLRKFLPSLKKAGAIVYKKNYMELTLPEKINKEYGFKEKVRNLIDLPEVEIHSPGLLEMHKFMQRVQDQLKKSF